MEYCLECSKFIFVVICFETQELFSTLLYKPKRQSDIVYIIYYFQFPSSCPKTFSTKKKCSVENCKASLDIIYRRLCFTFFSHLFWPALKEPICDEIYTKPPLWFAFCQQQLTSHSNSHVQISVCSFNGGFINSFKVPSYCYRHIIFRMRQWILRPWQHYMSNLS